MEVFGNGFNGYQADILAGKHAGLTEVPCWVRDLSDEDAYMQLVLCNTQSELHPLEEGKHAAESPQLEDKSKGLKAYADDAGRSKEYRNLAFKVNAFRVFDSVEHVFNQGQVDEQALFNVWRHNQVDNPHGVGEFEDYLKEFYVDRAKRLDIARDSWRNLAEIHAAPEWLWSASGCWRRIGGSLGLLGVQLEMFVIRTLQQEAKQPTTPSSA